MSVDLFGTELIKTVHEYCMIAINAIHIIRSPHTQCGV